MSEENATVTTQETPEQGRTFTQDEVNAIIGKRLAEDRAKYADYEALKEKAAKFDEAEEAAKSDLQKATERADELQAKLDTMIQADKLRRIQPVIRRNRRSVCRTGKGNISVCAASTDRLPTNQGYR